jgi:hypothetical protein
MFRVAYKGFLTVGGPYRSQLFELCPKAIHICRSSRVSACTRRRPRRRSEAAFQTGVPPHPHDLPAVFEPRDTCAPTRRLTWLCASIYSIRLSQDCRSIKGNICKINDVTIVIDWAGSYAHILHGCRMHKRQPHAASYSLAQPRETAAEAQAS